MSIELKNDGTDFLPFNTGEMPTNGEYYFACQFNAYKLKDKHYKYFNDFWHDGDRKRPIFIRQTPISLIRIKNLLERFDNNICAYVISNNNGPVYGHAQSNLQWSFFQGWLEQYTE